MMNQLLEPKISQFPTFAIPIIWRKCVLSYDILEATSWLPASWLAFWNAKSFTLYWTCGSLTMNSACINSDPEKVPNIGGQRQKKRDPHEGRATDVMSNYVAVGQPWQVVRNRASRLHSASPAPDCPSSRDMLLKKCLTAWEVEAQLTWWWGCQPGHLSEDQKQSEHMQA